ncbi:hypothetical protein WN943_002180 [Citrus x changshan-huyou]
MVYFAFFFLAEIVLHLVILLASASTVAVALGSHNMHERSQVEYKKALKFTILSLLQHGVYKHAATLWLSSPPTGKLSSSSSSSSALH